MVYCFVSWRVCALSLYLSPPLPLSDIAHDRQVSDADASVIADSTIAVTVVALVNLKPSTHNPAP